MASRKYNEYLDAGHSEDDELSIHYSDDAHEAKGKTTGPKNPAKRRKTNLESSDEGSEDEIVDNTGIDSPAALETTKYSPTPTPIDESTSRADPTQHRASQTPKPKTPPSSSKPGVIYLSRIPPFMRPSTVRHLLSPFGPITKLFLTPEPPAQRTSRVRSGGNKKRSFIDGWIEFSSHKHAKTCVAAINGQTMGGRGTGEGGEDSGGVRREKREREEFLKGVERGKVEETKRRKRREKKEGVDTVDDMKSAVGEGVKGGFERRFRQNEVKKREVQEQPDEVTRVLNKIF
ncbi:MAG: hypothetical protein LQ346_000932 [Caloplaca aetnensis]|nr:MAG: hypothetical protein LQ346_000932 [Caloplaca aetnensis]